MTGRPVLVNLMCNSSHLSVCQPEHGSQLFSVWLGDILLYFESLLKSFSLQIWKHCSWPWPFPLVCLWHCVFCEDSIGTCVEDKEGGHECKRIRETQGNIYCRTCQTETCLLKSYMWWLPGKVSWNWCWPDCLLLLLLQPSELIMEEASLIPGSMEEKYWLAGGWMGMWIPDWRFELTMDVRSVTEREIGFSQLRVTHGHEHYDWLCSLGGKMASSLERPFFESIYFFAKWNWAKLPGCCL